MDKTVRVRRHEYDLHVWDHTQDVFQASFDLRRPFSELELEVLDSLASGIGSGMDDVELARALKKVLASDPEPLFAVMQAAGLTRNKIITDMKASSAARGLRVPGKPIDLLRVPGTWEVAGPYLAFRVRKVLEPVATLPSKARRLIFEAINQATFPGWIRQERAKRQGHEAEARIATMLAKLGIPFVPEEKADNPMCRDAQINGISYDLVVPDLSNPVMVLKSTVQTANIGQFGESKADLEVSQAITSLDDAFGGKRPLLLAMIDGVGFRSNVAGLHGVLANADEFCQFETLWKAAVIAAHGVGEVVTVALPKGHAAEHHEFLGKFAGAVKLVDLSDRFRAADPASLVDAGEALLRIV